MANYLLIESRDPFEWNDVSRTYSLATGLAREGNQITLFLVQNGVFPARRSSKSAELTSLSKSGVRVLADDFSLRERGIGAGSLAEGVNSSAIDAVVDGLAAGHKAIWF
jgi:sulfur relay (sulfurtransferase) complex TusBCD TusD component (DsrE family)